MVHVMQLPADFAWIFLPFAVYVAARIFRAIRDRSSAGHLDAGGEPSGSARLSHSVLFRAAAAHGGRLTVSELVVETGMPPARAEKALREITDGLRVRMEIGDDGVVWYEFTELLRSAERPEADGEQSSENREIQNGD
ncbi:hypothetical protein [Salinispira pacifica]